MSGLGACPPLTVTVLGCGGSLGVPMVGNMWGTVDPANPKNRRTRPSILVQSASTTVLIDTSADCRSQLLAAQVTHIDAIVYTHDHADHVHGIDDIRPLCFNRDGLLPAYADAKTHQSLVRRFGYMFDGVDVDRGIYKPLMSLTKFDGPFMIGDIPFVPFRQQHGPTFSFGFRIGEFAYSTDASDLDEAAFDLLAGIGVWIVDAAREAPHPSHAHLSLALDWVDRLGPRQAYLTHMNHTMDYDRLCAMLPDGVLPAHDGLVIKVPG